MDETTLLLQPHYPAPRPQIKWMIVIAVLSAVFALAGQLFADRLLQEHTQVKSEVRLDNVEAKQRELTTSIVELNVSVVTKDELRASIHGIEQRLDDLRTIMLELREKR